MEKAKSITHGHFAHRISGQKYEKEFHDESTFSDTGYSRARLAQLDTHERPTEFPHRKPLTFGDKFGVTSVFPVFFSAKLTRRFLFQHGVWFHSSPAL